MTYLPTPEQFLAEPSTDEEDYDEPTISGATLTISPEGLTFGRLAPLPPDPLASIAASLERLVASVEADAAVGAADVEAERRYLDLDAAYADLEDKHRALYELLAEVEKIVAKSSSQVSLAVKDAINRWRNPVVEGDPAEPPSADQPQQPAADASLDKWREYARARGVENAEQLNRSQIRTALGLPHSDTPAGV